MLMSYMQNMTNIVPRLINLMLQRFIADNQYMFVVYYPNSAQYIILCK